MTTTTDNLVHGLAYTFVYANEADAKIVDDELSHMFDIEDYTRTGNAIAFHTPESREWADDYEWAFVNGDLVDDAIRPIRIMAIPG